LYRLGSCLKRMVDIGSCGQRLRSRQAHRHPGSPQSSVHRHRGRGRPYHRAFWRSKRSLFQRGM